MKCVAFHNHSGEYQISHDYLILLAQRCNKYLNSVCSEVNYCTSVTGENGPCQVYCEGILLEHIINWDS